jgi:hypothetical protein
MINDRGSQLRGAGGTRLSELTLGYFGPIGGTVHMCSEARAVDPALLDLTSHTPRRSEQPPADVSFLAGDHHLLRQPTGEIDALNIP